MTHSVNDLASSFVEMAKAYERLPEVENDLTAALHTINNLNDTIASMNRTLIDRTNTINELNSRIHDLEATREDAELRFLECDDAKTTLERTLEGLGKDIASVLAAVQPIPRPEPAPTVEPTHSLTSGGLAKEPTDAQVLEATPIPFAEGTSLSDASSTDAGTGQSEDHPTDTVSSTLTDQSMNAPIQSVETQGHVDTPTSVGEGVSVPSDPTPAHSAFVNADGPSSTALPPLPLVSVSSTNEASWYNIS